MQTSINVIIGTKIKELREKQGKTIERLAYENDITKSTLSRIERGLVDPKLTTIYKIAEALECNIKDLF